MRLLSELRQQALERPRADFMAEFNSPALVFDPFSEAVETNFQTVAMVAGPLGRPVVAQVKKRAGANSFTTMITLGRAANNDIEVPVDSISKFHGYFLEESGTLSWVDAGSANGSSVDGTPVHAKEKSPLQSGVRLSFGQVEATLYDSKGLYDYLADGAEQA
jgi:pSer/pThr/pTyr-binding forkhead associated (FHA) protein